MVCLSPTIDSDGSVCMIDRLLRWRSNLFQQTIFYEVGPKNNLLLFGLAVSQYGEISIFNPFSLFTSTKTPWALMFELPSTGNHSSSSP